MAENSSKKRKLPDDLDLFDKPKQQEKRVRFPKGKKVKPEDQVPVVQLPAEEEKDVEPETEAQIAARERALRRKMNIPADEDTDMLHDISVAEVRYQDNDTFVDDGVNIEPFNLEKENKEGFFDETGNYVEYVNEKQIKDAWLDNVDDTHIDPKLAGKRIETADEEESFELSSKEIGTMKRRMADVLLPGETDKDLLRQRFNPFVLLSLSLYLDICVVAVLQALRRLKGSSTSKKEKMSAETKVIFDQLTEDAMRLMENGDYNVYDENKEVFQREAEGYEKLAQLRGEGTSVNSEQVDDELDMFAEDDEKANANPASGEGDLVSGSNSNGNNQPSESASLQSDYVYDESSGYYYSSSTGYYYDPSSGLYCSASGQW
uniref:OCRE domain-containing protein n=1 Tax=Daucus carota subsp. sativus TaxID=79200 RepID=A0A161ZV94_DAUCS